MASPLKDKIRAAAALDTGLQGSLGTNPFRMYDTQLNQGSAMPACVVQIVDSPKDYTFTARLATGWSRVQFTLWSTNDAAGFTKLANLEAALYNFLDSLNLIGIAGLKQYPSRVVSRRDGFFAQTQPGNPLILIDAQIFSNDSL